MTPKKLTTGIAVIALSLATLAHSPVNAQRTIEQAADSLLTEVLSLLEIQITNTELLLELSYEVQYALDTGIVDAETINELDIEVLNEELPDEELFEEDPENPDSSTPTTVVAGATTPLSEELRIRLRNRLTLHLATQVKYWEVIAGDWATASQLSARDFNTCLDAATTDEESDVCYFNEQQQLQFFYARQLAENFGLRLTSANQLGQDVVALLNQSMTRSRLMVQEALQFMNAEELGTLGLTPNALEEISRKLESHTSPSPAPSPGPSPGPSNSTPANGQNQ
ncbi:unannotated protein [freshwater metagenome]|uniref:Unannotated protein n=1 Tax=freshwater metagenome TaxID=449393 RepID=A0A6J6EFE7_9ZZZZ